jgi:glycosyltransferase involved in cell wall biosynthesis
MKVLFVGPATSPHVFRWVDHLRGRGHEVLLATLHDVPGTAQKGVIPLARRPAPGRAPARELPGAVLRLRKTLRGFRPDVTLAYYLRSYGLITTLAGAEPRVGAAAGGDVLTDEFDTRLHRLRDRCILAVSLRGFDRMLAWAPHVGDRLVELGVERGRVLVQPRGVNLELFSFREPRPRAPGEPLRVLSTRWLKPLYRVETLMDALGRLHRRGVPFEARIVGDGPERARLESMGAQTGLDEAVTFLGSLPAHAIPEQVAWAHVYVSTSCTDGASSSLFEAMAVGSCPVVSDIPANRPYLQEGKTGELFPVGDSETLARKLAVLAEDDPLRMRMVRAGRAFAEEALDYNQNMERIESFVCGAVRRRTDGGPA